MDIISFVYGLAFILLGAVIFVQPRKYSEYALANVIWLLAAFGLVHGILEWTDLWKIVKGDSPFLRRLQVFLLVASFGLLFEFSRRLLKTALGDDNTWSKLLDVKIYGAVLLAMAGGAWLASDPVQGLIVWTRYALGFPAALGAGLGLHYYFRHHVARFLPEEESLAVRRYFMLAMVAFGAYGFFAGLVVPASDFPPANILNDQVFLSLTGVPVQLFRAACAVLAALSVAEILSIFHLEIAGRLLGQNRKLLDYSEQESRLAATTFEAQEGMIITNAESVILRVNQAFTDITGYTAEEAVGQTPRLLKSGRHDARFYQAMWEILKHDKYWQGEIWNRRKNGEVFPAFLAITAVKGYAGEISHYVGMLSDITTRKAAEEEIQQLAFYDSLTHLPNRHLLVDRLHQALAVSARSGREGALMFIDLDNFKTLNNTLGHDKGDQLLHQVAQRLSTCVREGDTVARQGGDEFVVMLEDLSGNSQEAAAQTKTLGEKILATLSQPYQLAGHEHYITASIGVTLFTDQRATVDEMLKQADLAMYQAKAAGRNTLCFFDLDMQALVTSRAALEVDMRQGLHQDEFLLYFQAQVDGAGRLTGAEALVRWQHPRRGLVLPAEFIPLAEDTGLILPLGHWVLETACAQLVAWAAQTEMARLTLSVNVSARQFRHPDFVDQVLAILDSSGADPQKLKLELTESLLLDNVEDIVSKMMALKACGVGFSLDDFGTGYSSLSYLKRLPLDQLKIDQSFVRDVLTDPNDAAIARTIVALAQNLGLAVIAEGVETEAQRDFLALHGCHAYQGYLFGRPGRVEALLAMDTPAGKTE